MAYYAALVSLVELLEDIIHRDSYQKLYFLLDRQQIASLYEKFSHLQARLGDGYSPKDEAAADFLERRIRDAAYKVQNIIESQISAQAPPKVKTHGVKRLFRCLISAFQKVNPWQLKDLEKVEKEVVSIVEEVMRIKKSHTTEDNLELNYTYSADNGASKQAPSSRNAMVGFDECLTTIKEQLCGDSSKLEVISIVGMGGIGKTTLARNIFDDELIVYHFYCRAWVTVSQDYHLRKVLLGILDSMNIDNKSSKVEADHVLVEHIYRHLKGMRYLIIIDDIWDTKVWDDVKRIFPDDSNGSRIILTTRLSNVGAYANSSGFLHQMQFLNEDQSWNLFREQVFCPPELEDIGRQIANNCRGLPLAIVVVAGLLSKVKKARYDWEEISRNVSSASTENDEHFSNILSSSYNHLPHHLKPCLLYLGGFPEDHEIRISKLIKLWVAEGFLKSIESKSLEEVAEEYLEDLVSRNLVLITKRSSNSQFKCCSIHDVLRDLCIERTRQENFLHVLDGKDYSDPKPTRNVSRLYIHPSYSYFIEDAEECDKHVRSILCFYCPVSFLSFASGFKLLRVLDAVNVAFYAFHDEILELFHLRYLAFRGSAGQCFRIPQSISKLQNLQTLIVISLEAFSEGFGILLLSHLRHVMVGNLGLPPVPLAILSNLQTLSKIRDFNFTNEFIEMIPNLRTLKVGYNYDTYQKWLKFGLNNLIRLSQLETLEILFPYLSLSRNPDPFPDSFSFPLKLRKLTLGGCRLLWKDLTVVGSLPNLEVLKLRKNALEGEEWEPIEGEFSRLKFLLMDNLNLKYWRAENTDFPRLEHLEIRYCFELKEIPPEIGDIPTLELIKVHCSKLAAESALRIAEEQRSLGNNVIQVHVVQQESHYF